MLCEIDIKDMEEYATTLYKMNAVKGVSVDDDGDNNNVVVIRRSLKINLKGISLPPTTLELILHFPILEIHPTVLNCGNVWIGDSNKSSFIIYNCSGRKVYNYPERILVLVFSRNFHSLYFKV